jgi:hypothetical protein
VSFTRYGTREIRESTKVSVVSGGLTGELVSTLQGSYTKSGFGGVT